VIRLGVLLILALLPQADAQKRAEQLLRALASSNVLERERAAGELASWGDDYAKHVEAASKTGDADFQARCAEILQQIDFARRGRADWAPARPATASHSGTIKDGAERLTKLYGYPIALGEADPKKRATFKMDSGTFLQALEGLCRSAGVWYRWNDNGVELTKDKPPDLSRVHVGPFAIAARVTTLEDHPGLFIHFDTDWERKVVPGWFEVKIDSMTDDKGNAVLQARRKENGFLGEATLTKKFSVKDSDQYRQEWTEDDFLLGPTSPGAAKLSSVKGKVTFWFPLEVSRVRFEDPKPKAQAPAGPFTAEINFYDFYKDRKSWDVQMEVKIGDPSREIAVPLFAMLVNRSIRFIDAAGKSVDSGVKGGHGRGGTGANMFQRIHIDRSTNKLPLENPPKWLECDVVTSVWTRSFSFEFKDVRLTKEKK
jgi:hypothetical protein